MMTDDEMRIIVRRCFEKNVAAHPELFARLSAAGMGPRELARRFIEAAPATPECQRVKEMIEDGDFDQMFAGALGMMRA